MTSKHTQQENGSSAGAASGSHRGLIIAAIAVLAALAVAYVIGVFYFSSHFTPNTSVGGIDASGLTVADVAERAEQSAASYADQVSGQGVDFTLTAADLGLKVDAQRFAEEAFATQNAWAWPVSLVRGASLSPTMAASVDEAQVLARVSEQVASFNESAQAPVDAHLAYNEGTGSYEVAPEEEGTQLDAELVAAQVASDAKLLHPQTKLGTDVIRTPQLKSDSSALADAAAKANELIARDIELKRGDMDVYHVDRGLIHTWLESYPESPAPAETTPTEAAPAENAEESGSEGGSADASIEGTGEGSEGSSEENADENTEEGADGEWVYDEETDDWYWSEGEPEPAPWELPNDDPGYTFVDEKTGIITHVRINRNLIRQWSFDTLNDIVNGEDEVWYWEINSWETAGVLKAAIDEGRDGNLDVVADTTQIRPEESEGHEGRGRHIDVNLGTQYARLYDNDGKTVLWRSYIVSGNPNLGRDTPTGDYEITDMGRNVTLKGEDYESFVYYWMCFLGNAYGLHDATWRWSGGFGGDVYLYDGSHGCVNLPYDAAEELYGLIEVGTPVHIHY